MASASDVSIETTRACACGERSTAMCSMPGITMSPAYLSAPDTLLGRVEAPDIGADEAAVLLLVLGERGRGQAAVEHVAGELDRVEYLLIAGAAADIAAEPLLDLLAADERIGADRRGRRHHHAGDAIAALAGAGLVERLLQHASARRSARGLRRSRCRRLAPWRPASGRTSSARRRRTPSRSRIRRRRSLPSSR